MNRYQILHRTAYTFSGLVELGPHSLRLRPREGHELRIESSSLAIQPRASLRWHRDVEDNSVVMATFQERSDRLVVESSLIIQQYNQEPLDFLVQEYAVDYPFSYTPEDLPVLDAYRIVELSEREESLSRWLAALWQPGESIQSYALLQRLNQTIHGLVSYRLRHEPGVQPAAETLATASGSCRDVAYLFIVVARMLGFAARFVSGYSHTPPTAGDAGHTHAWAEVFLPGAGWKGFDPSGGEIVGRNHIPVAVARLPGLVPPIAGTFKGSAAERMEVSVQVSPLG
jgi:transglutaminase-like putative cysteine protease